MKISLDKSFSDTLVSADVSFSKKRYTFYFSDNIIESYMERHAMNYSGRWR
jgi:hypothetical protein